MTKLISLFFLLICLPAHAIMFEVMELCKKEQVLFEEIDIMFPATVSHVSHYFLKAFGIPYEASETSMVSMMGSPSGNDAMEVVDKDHYRFYGWCYLVDGFAPDVTMDKFMLNPEKHKRLTWYYGYAEVVAGEWIHYCEPLFYHPDQFICKNQYHQD
jgi:hypothetical protein